MLTDVSVLQGEKAQVRKELWRIEDVMAGLSTSKANYRVTISSITNPGDTLECHTSKTKENQPKHAAKLHQLVKLILRPAT